MKPLTMIGAPPQGASVEQRVNWCMAVIAKIVTASQADTDKIADAYAVTHLPATPVRALNVSTAAAADVAQVLGQYLADMQKRGLSGGKN